MPPPPFMSRFRWLTTTRPSPVTRTYWFPSLTPRARPVGRVDTPDQTIAAGKTESFETEVPVERPALWSADSPHLYQTRTHLLVNHYAVDSVTTAFGIRSIVMNGQSGFLLKRQRSKDARCVRPSRPRRIRSRFARSSGGTSNRSAQSGRI